MIRRIFGRVSGTTTPFPALTQFKVKRARRMPAGARVCRWLHRVRTSVDVFSSRGDVRVAGLLGFDRTGNRPRLAVVVAEADRQVGAGPRRAVLAGFFAGPARRVRENEDALDAPRDLSPHQARSADRLVEGVMERNRAPVRSAVGRHSNGPPVPERFISDVEQDAAVPELDRHRFAGVRHIGRMVDDDLAGKPRCAASSL